VSPRSSPLEIAAKIAPRITVVAEKGGQLKERQ